jgi:hypothetical protein
MKSFELEEPWYEEENQNFIQELKKEVSVAHILWGKNLKVIAKREDCDDILFQVENADFDYAVVHLTWTSKVELNAIYPRTRTYKTWDELVEKCLKPDIKEFNT